MKVSLRRAWISGLITLAILINDPSGQPGWHYALAGIVVGLASLAIP